MPQPQNQSRILSPQLRKLPLLAVTR
jgi:hypothetical protein